MAKAMTLLYGPESKGDAAGASAFISRLMHCANAIHMHHLMVEGPGSYAAHNALSVYEPLREAVDGLAEAWMGCTGEKLKFGPGAFEMAPTPLAKCRRSTSIWNPTVWSWALKAISRTRLTPSAR